MKEIEAQVNMRSEEGYCLHSIVVAQPNPRFNSDASGPQASISLLSDAGQVQSYTYGN